MPFTSIYKIDTRDSRLFDIVAHIHAHIKTALSRTDRPHNIRITSLLFSIDVCVCFLKSPDREDLSEKLRRSNHIQMFKQMQYLLFNQYFKTLSVGPVIKPEPPTYYAGTLINWLIRQPFDHQSD